MKKYRIGYTAGVFDLFHVGHLNIIEKSKEMCEVLIVGVTTDQLAQYKNVKPVIPYHERARIVESIRYVDRVVPQETLDKMEAWYKYRFDAMFVGDDWKGTDRWNRYEEEFSRVGVDIIYFPYTVGTSSTLLRAALRQIVGDA